MSVPWILEVADGSLLAREAAYTMEHLVEDISVKIDHPGGDNRNERLFTLVRGVLAWAAWLIKFGTEHGLHLDDASPRNSGFEPQEAKWKLIDAGCYKLANGPRAMVSVWDGFRNCLHRFKGSYVGTKGFLDLLDVVMERYLDLSLAVQALRQGREVGDLRWAAAREVGAKFLRRLLDPDSGAAASSSGHAQGEPCRFRELGFLCRTGG